MSRLSKLSSLTLLIEFYRINWGHDSDPYSPIQHTRWTTRLLEHVPERARLKGAIRVQFELWTVAALGGPLSRGGPSLEACTALEDAILTLPGAFDVQFCWPEHRRRRAGRPVFWSPTIASAFPKLSQRGLLTLPHSKSMSDHSDRKELIVSIPKHTPQTCLATKALWHALLLHPTVNGS